MRGQQHLAPSRLPLLPCLDPWFSFAGRNSQVGYPETSKFQFGYAAYLTQPFAAIRAPQVQRKPIQHRAVAAPREQDILELARTSPKRAETLLRIGYT